MGLSATDWLLSQLVLTLFTSSSSSCFHLTIDQLINPSMNSSIHPSNHSSSHPPIYLSIHSPIYPSTHPSIHPLLHEPTQSSIHPLKQPPIHTYLCIYICMCIHTCVHMYTQPPFHLHILSAIIPLSIYPVIKPTTHWTSHQGTHSSIHSLTLPSRQPFIHLPEILTHLSMHSLIYSLIHLSNLVINSFIHT